MNRHLLSAAAATCLLAVAVSAPGTAVGAGDQERAEAAIAVFNGRLEDAGWTSTGQPEETEPAEEGESEFGECFDGLERILDNTGEEIDGETARAYSDEFTFEGEGDDEGSFAAAVVISVDDSGLGQVESFVMRLGEQETGACLTELFEEEFAADDAEVAVTVDVSDDLGVGDLGGALDFAVSSEVEDRTVSYAFTLAAVLVERTLVAAIGGSIQEDSPFDAVAELEAMVAAIA
jgi:hypothetical protein